MVKKKTKKEEWNSQQKWGMFLFLGLAVLILIMAFVHKATV